jgi:transposase
MPRFIEGQDRQQVTLMPECLDDFIGEDNPVRVIDAFVSELNPAGLGFEGAEPAATGRPSYHPADLLKVYIYGYLNRIQSSRCLERECQRNLELMWLTGRLAPDFKTIADFRRNNGAGIRNVCRRFVALCQDLKLFSQALVAIDGSKFKAVNTRDKNFTAGKIEKRQQLIEESIHRYLVALDTADRTQPVEFEAKTTRLKTKIEQLRKQMRVLDEMKVQVATEPDGQISKTDPDARSMATSGRGFGIVGYNVQVAVDAKYHLIVTQEVTNFGHDRVSLAPVAQAARHAMGRKRLRAIADPRLLHCNANQGLCRQRRRGDPAEAHDIRSEGGRSVRPIRLHLHREGRRVRVPRR